jgi:predicted Zn-dependent protease
MVKISIAKVRASNQQLPKAIKSLKQLNRVYPKHLAIQLTLAETLIRDQQPKKAIKHLINITEYAPDNIDAWYLLAEAQGLAGNKNKLHSARIEYFLLKGLVQSAKQQLSFARRERRLSTKEIYVLDDLEQHILEVEDFMNTKY